MESKLKLADLHRHLDGSLRPSTVADLAAERGLNVPENLLFYKGMGLQEALTRFAYTVDLLDGPAPIERVANEIVEDARADQVTTLEIRFAPQLHDPDYPERIVDAALAGIQGRAGLILCGLYGEDPSRLLELTAIAAARPGVVGIDLAGGPHSSHQWQLADYRPAFELAASHDLGRTVHAAEGRPAAEIGIAIRDLHAQRIGHGTTLLSDRNIAELVREAEVTIEACPTSNVHTGVINSVGEHPIGDWLKLGIKACLNTDNTLLSDITLSEELRRVVQSGALAYEQQKRLVELGHNACFSRTKALLKALS